MSVLARPTEASVAQGSDFGSSVVFEGASWSFYQRVLREIGDSHRLRVNYFEGRMEIVSPLPIHEALGRATTRVIWCIAEGWDIECKCFGSTTFFAKGRRAGLEPDDSFYFGNIEKVVGMEKFDANVHPAPDLAIEVEVTTPAVPKLPIYAALGVPEIWRWERESLRFYRRVDAGYLPIHGSDHLPGISPDFVEGWVKQLRMSVKENLVCRALRESLRSSFPKR